MDPTKSIHKIKVIREAMRKWVITLTDWEKKFLLDIEEDVLSGKTLSWRQGKKLREIYDKIK